MITIGAYIEAMLDTASRFRTLHRLHPVTDHNGQPVFSVSGEAVRFSVMHEGIAKSLWCALTERKLSAAESDRILDITNRNNPYIAPCEVRKGEILVFDTAGIPRRNDIMLCNRPSGVQLPMFVRANLNCSDRKPLRELLRNIAAMARSLGSDSITHGNLKPENIYITPNSKPCTVDFTVTTGHGQGDDIAFGLIALNIFLLGCEPKLYARYGGAEMFRRATFISNERHIMAQAEFSKLHPVAEIADIIKVSHSTAGQADMHSPHAAAGCREKLCCALYRLAATPFVPMPILLGLAPCTAEIPTITGMTAAVGDITAVRDEDISVRIDFRRCEFVGNISDTLIRFRLDDKWGFADRYGRRLCGEEYLSAEDFYEGRAKVEIDSGCGLIDRNGEYIMQPVYEILEWYGEENVVTACHDGQWELYDRGGKQLTAAAYDWIGGAGEGALIAQRGDKFGFITSCGIPITDIRYDEAYSFRGGSALVVSGGKSHRIDKTNEKSKMEN